MLQPLSSHHPLLVVPCYTFIKLFLFHLQPPSHSMYIISFSRASRTSTGTLTYAPRVCARVCKSSLRARAGLCMCTAACVGVFRKKGERGGMGRWRGCVAISILQNVHYSSQAKQLVRARARAHLLAMVLAAVQERAENALPGTGRNTGRRELHVIAPPLTRPRVKTASVSHSGERAPGLAD